MKYQVKQEPREEAKLWDEFDDVHVCFYLFELARCENSYYYKKWNTKKERKPPRENKVKRRKLKKASQLKVKGKIKRPNKDLNWKD